MAPKFARTPIVLMCAAAWTAIFLQGCSWMKSRADNAVDSKIDNVITGKGSDGCKDDKDCSDDLLCIEGKCKDLRK